MFRQQIRGLASERFVYIDESGFQDTLDYPYGYCHRSERFYAEKLGHRTERLSVIGAWREGEVIAPMILEGYVNSEVFCQWFKEQLVVELLPGQIVILDNASFHPKSRLKKLLKGTGCEILFLPPYSPDLNKIEKFWSHLKKKVSQIIREDGGLFQALSMGLRLLS